MVVDDSAVIRGLITRMLEADSEVRVVESVSNGQMAVNQLIRHKGEIDVIILDIEMPVMDGLTALPKLLEIDSNVKVIMASTLTKRNAEISLRAMSAGATDYVPKPSTARELSGAESEFRRDLLDKVKGLGILHRKASAPSRFGRTTPAPAAISRPGAAMSTPKTAAPADGAPAKWELKRSTDVVLRDPGKSKPDILAVGSSTGGPQALFDFFKALPKTLKVPVVITQHMPATFTAILAEHITKTTGWNCREAQDGDVLEMGKILLAPGDYHMTVVQKGPQRVVKLNQNPPENFCRPAVDPMLRSLVDIYGGRVFTVILTGMGNDGQKGSKVVVEAGGTVIAQDEASSVVWGMPGAVATTGLCSAVMPVAELAAYAARHIGS
ncbi:MAG: chemotaxis response regulator protein-glutamate methylesterase [Alphaproteobacteria bacterium]|nr:chemotaxis response regulator protein-glutamate methylesterase [Alphaproteobacteria bacterium]